MKVEVSVGEVIDKLSILHIKMKKIVDENKQREIQKEIDCLQECVSYTQKYEYFYNLLIYVNEKIWDLTDTVKTNPPNYAEISKDIFDYNQKRFRIKNWFNLLTNSNIKEQKSYQKTNCYIEVDENTYFSKLPQITYLALEYDTITINHPNVLSIPTIKSDESNETKNIISNLDFDVPDIFIIPPTSYIVAGMLGDLIHSLSVICEKYYKTGSKGILYMSENGEIFRNGLLNTYNDIYSVIIKQPYIQEFKIHNNELFDINLVEWRSSPLIMKDNWHNIYKSTYNVEWGKRKWIESAHDPLWSDKIVVNTTSHRFPASNNFLNIFNNKIDYTNFIFISSDKSHYDFFKERTNNNLTYYQIKSFEELITIINSCKLFIGGFSAPLAIAHSLHKDRIICNSESNEDTKMNNLTNFLPNIQLIV